MRSILSSTLNCHRVETGLQSVRWLLTPPLLLFVLTPCEISLAQDTHIARLVVESSWWSGIGGSERATLVIQRQNGHYQTDKGIINAHQVEAFVGVLKGPALQEPTLLNLGVDQFWLDTNAQPALEARFPTLYEDTGQNQRELFISSFRNLALADKALKTYFHKARWTDDYPEVTVTLHWSDGRITRLHSKRQVVFMLPWEVTQRDRTVTTWNAEVSRALAALLPEDFPNRYRLSGEGLRGALSRRIAHSVERQWNLLDMENKIGKEVQELGQRYSIVSSLIAPLSSIDVDPWGDVYTTSWNATLIRSDLPSYVRIGISIPFTDGRLGSLQPFEDRIDSFVDLVLSVPWLSQYLKRHPATRLYLRFVADRSLSSKAKTTFLEDMHRGERFYLIGAVESALDESAFLEIQQKSCWSRWIVLPDGRAILWHFKCDQVLKWAKSSLKTFECTGWSCAGAIITRDGSLESQ